MDDKVNHMEQEEFKPEEILDAEKKPGWTRKGIKEVEVEGQIINLKKGRFGYKIVHPVKNRDGSMNWFNLLTGGSWGNIIGIAIIVALIIFACWAYKQDVQALTECCQNFYNSQIGNVQGLI